MEEAFINQSLIHCHDGTLADPSIGCVQTPEALVKGGTNVSESLIQVASGFSSVLAIVASVALIAGSFYYLTSQGNQDRMDKGKRILFWSLFALILGLMGKFIITSLLGSIEA